MVVVDCLKGMESGVQVHQLLCGREIAKDRRNNMLHQMAAQMANYVYLVTDTESGTACIIDPAWDTDGCFEFAEGVGVKITHALFTHRHFDHTGGRVPRAMTGAKQDIHLPGLFDFLERGVACYVGERDAEAIAKQSGVSISRIKAVGEGSTVRVSDTVEIKVLATPGHTPGSVCFAVGDALCTGDTLFIGSCGRVDLPESDVQAMLGSLNRLAKLPKDTVVLPGHNYAMEAHSTIGGERELNHMMMQAISRSERSDLSAEPVCAQLPLPDYLGVARRVFARFEAGQWAAGGGGGCCESEPDGNVVQNAKQLESHF